MVDIHKSFLGPFFKEMNLKYKNEWCVLHSYDTLPFFSVSDVDMAFSGNDTKGLENLIYDVAIQNGWHVLQKLWYDIETCYYYILKDSNNEVYLALDFLIDNRGLGRYGFKTSILTKRCKVEETNIPVPNSEVAFTYKFVKRLVKKRDMIEDSKYMESHYSKSNKDELLRLLVEQFGKKSTELITKCLEHRNYTLDENYNDILLKNRREVLSQKSNKVTRKVLNLKRIFNRVLFPSGMIIHVPISQKKSLEVFKSTLEKKVGIAFRFVKLNSSNSFINKIRWMSGSTLVICKTHKAEPKCKIRWSWLRTKNVAIKSKDLNDLDYLSEICKEEIIKTLTRRKMMRKV